MNYYLSDKANKLKIQIEEYLEANTEFFLKDYYQLCYDDFISFEERTEGNELTELDSNQVYDLILKLKDEIDNMPCKEVRRYSNDNHFWEVKDIFKIKPKRYGIHGDEVVWEYFALYFELHSISIDVVSFEYIVEKVREILEIYYLYAVHYEKAVLSEYWDRVIEPLIRARYDCIISDMNVLE